MPNWIITPDKYLSDEEVNKLIRTWMIIDLALNTQIHVPLDLIDFQLISNGYFFVHFWLNFYN